MKVRVIGGGLAGCECANSLAKKGIETELYDMKPALGEAFHTAKFGELVCSNSLKSDVKESASGMLKAEMKEMGSLTIEAAYLFRVPSGQDLSVDREKFSAYIDEKIRSNPLIKVFSQKLDKLPEDGINIVCTGPLTDGNLLSFLQSESGEKTLSFFDAAAPLVYFSSLDTSKMYLKSRYDKGEGKYLNIPLTEEQYFAFTTELAKAKKTILHDFDHFEGCLPIETMALRGKDTLRFGPLKPKGLETEDIHPFAVVQLRQDDAAGELYNLVGFQTNLTFPEQKRVLSLLPGLENVKFARFGQMHRNSYINAPLLLNRDLSLKKNKDVFIAGQLSGVEGYMESAATGLLASYYVSQRLRGVYFDAVPLDTMIGSLVNYLVMASAKDFQPMNACYGILEAENRKDRLGVYNNAVEEIKAWVRRNSSK
jgi:methylenetetrahydrofolate--tRNA-(uracil-5-)-methyltransferase